MESIPENIFSELKKLGFSLADYQPHLSGERFLMMKDKLVLVGYKLSDQKKAIIKLSNQASGQEEINREKHTRDILQSLTFANDIILFPKEIYYGHQNDYLIWITEFIEQEKIFVSHNLKEQFFLALRAFEAQEAFHATTYEHLRSAKKAFPFFSAKTYLNNLEKFKNRITNRHLKSIANAPLDNALAILTKHRAIIDRYANYLTHTDFVPHNFRLQHRQIYLLDLSSVYFGNKYEGWARFLNYMLIHNPELESTLSSYIHTNRGPEEYLSLRLMRVYKLVYLLDYYSSSLEKTEGDLRELTERRINFWQYALVAILNGTTLSQEILKEYLNARDNLRSKEEKGRQREFAVA